MCPGKIFSLLLHLLDTLEVLRIKPWTFYVPSIQKHGLNPARGKNNGLQLFSI
jgi:hypothetical protein